MAARRRRRLLRREELLVAAQARGDGKAVQRAMDDWEKG